MCVDRSRERERERKRKRARESHICIYIVPIIQYWSPSSEVVTPALLRMTVYIPPTELQGEGEGGKEGEREAEKQK